MTLEPNFRHMKYKINVITMHLTRTAFTNRKLNQLEHAFTSIHPLCDVSQLMKTMGEKKKKDRNLALMTAVDNKSRSHLGLICERQRRGDHVVGVGVCTSEVDNISGTGSLPSFPSFSPFLLLGTDRCFQRSATYRHSAN